MGHFAAVVTSTVYKTPILKMNNSFCCMQFMQGCSFALGSCVFCAKLALQFDSLTNVSSVLKVTVYFGCFRFLTFYFNFSRYDPFKNFTNRQLCFVHASHSTVINSFYRSVDRSHLKTING